MYTEAKLKFHKLSLLRENTATHDGLSRPLRLKVECNEMRFLPRLRRLEKTAPMKFSLNKTFQNLRNLLRFYDKSIMPIGRINYI